MAIAEPIQIPVPESGKDIPSEYTFDGWHRSLNPHAPPSWYAFLKWNNGIYPPMAQQVAVSLHEIERLSLKSRVNLVKGLVEEAIKLNEVTIKALGWDKGAVPIWSNMKARD